MNLCRLVWRRAGLVTAGLVSIAIAVAATALVVRPGTIEAAPTMLLVVLLGLLLLPICTLWAMRVDRRIRVAEARWAEDQAAQASTLGSSVSQAVPTVRVLHHGGTRRVVSHRPASADHESPHLGCEDLAGGDGGAALPDVRRPGAEPVTAA